MYLPTLAFLALNFWSCFPFHHFHKLKNTTFFQLPALLISVWNAILRLYSLLKQTCWVYSGSLPGASGLHLCWSKVKWTAYAKQLFTVGYSSTLMVSMCHWTPQTPVAMTEAMTEQWGLGALEGKKPVLIQECVYLWNWCVFMLSVTIKPLSFLTYLQLDMCRLIAESAWPCEYLCRSPGDVSAFPNASSIRVMKPIPVKTIWYLRESLIPTYPSLE